MVGHLADLDGLRYSRRTGGFQAKFRATGEGQPGLHPYSTDDDGEDVNGLRARTIVCSIGWCYGDYKLDTTRTMRIPISNSAVTNFFIFDSEIMHYFPRLWGISDFTP